MILKETRESSSPSPAGAHIERASSHCLAVGVEDDPLEDEHAGAGTRLGKGPHQLHPREVPSTVTDKFAGKEATVDGSREAAFEGARVSRGVPGPGEDERPKAVAIASGEV